MARLVNLCHVCSCLDCTSCSHFLHVGLDCLGSFEIKTQLLVFSPMFHSKTSSWSLPEVGKKKCKNLLGNFFSYLLLIKCYFSKESFDTLQNYYKWKTWTFILKNDFEKIEKSIAKCQQNIEVRKKDKIHELRLNFLMPFHFLPKKFSFFLPFG